MDIRNVGVRLDGTPKAGRSSVTRSGSPATSKSEKTAEHDFFEDSGQLGQVRALIDALVQTPDYRPEVVERARALLSQGQLDSPEAAARAAAGLTEEQGGLAG